MEPAGPDAARDAAADRAGLISHEDRDLVEGMDPGDRHVPRVDAVHDPVDVLARSPRLRAQPDRGPVVDHA
jgi:hypothetical protein